MPPRPTRRRRIWCSQWQRPWVPLGSGRGGQWLLQYRRELGNAEQSKQAGKQAKTRENQRGAENGKLRKRERKRSRTVGCMNDSRAAGSAKTLAGSVLSQTRRQLRPRPNPGQMARKNWVQGWEPACLAHQRCRRHTNSYKGDQRTSRRLRGACGPCLHRLPSSLSRSSRNGQRMLMRHREDELCWTHATSMSVSRPPRLV